MSAKEIECAADEEKTDLRPIPEESAPKSEERNSKLMPAADNFTRCITPFPRRCHRSKNL